MEYQLFAVGIGVLGLGLTWLLYTYVQRLPVAPSCPACRAVTRETDARGWAVQLVPALAVTYVGECTRCGWRGRLRWRWAPRSTRR